MQWQAMEARTPMGSGRGSGEKSSQGLEASGHGGLLAEGWVWAVGALDSSQNTYLVASGRGERQ